MTGQTSYCIRRALQTPEFQGLWDGPAWGIAETLSVENFHAASSPHRPTTRAKVLYDTTGLYVMFRVEDRYVRATREDLNARVCNDACVEFFVQPKPGNSDMGYFNFEMNCIGALYLTYVEDPARTPEGLGKATRPLQRLIDQMRIHHSVPTVMFPENKGDLTWTVEYSIPFALLEAHVGALGAVAGQEWRGNFYKCAEDNSHPHWATWAPIGDELNFHLPQYFAAIRFEV
jgi:formate-dependent nitrite reductase cytochrome c552 subunit